MKKIAIILLLMIFTFGCKSTEEIQDKSVEKLLIAQKDSISKVNKELNSLVEKYRDSVSVYKNHTETTETTITKATNLETDISNICDSLGNLNSINQTLGSENHELIIRNINGKLNIQSKQNQDLVSTIKTIKSEYERLESKYSELESKHSQETETLEKSILEKDLQIKKLKSTETTNYTWSKWTYTFLISAIALLLILISPIKNYIPTLIKII
ncbi:hypothetical protein [Wenyingzhuangia sp. 2_MG-2023]|uniref:hypothetical protein n=1 Tax=Wenyingzhuangia sp. 2_MG-2023 TaxID=3062639 RepID=UPI0026E1672A|nr:hypothetical protein [Wenyingzhuangia sp. 2_MG-2023]MDO6737090.1 hypothetical protein [Wenyingzhuangia sp. 2_MG-2023]